jgi:anti-sigma regulatory factor (Ser/Thr protein kinase)
MSGKARPARQPAASGHAGLAVSGTSPTRASYGSPPIRPAGEVRVPPFAVSRESSFADRWPLQDFLELGAFPGAVPCARLHTRQVLWEWRLTSLSESAGLLVSELVTNAVQISRADAQTAPVRLWLLADRTRVVILVWDASPLPPVRMNASEDAENGRGLLLVDTISERWAWYFPPQETGGKVVWAALEMRSP